MPKTAKVSKTQKSKKQEKLSPKESAFVEARLQGASLKEAAESAGYSPSRQSGFNVEQRVTRKCPEIFNEMGLTVERFGQKLQTLLDATETKYFAYNGIVLDSRDVLALEIQLRATEIGLRAHGAFARNDKLKVDVTSVPPFDLSKIPDEVLREVFRLANEYGIVDTGEAERVDGN